MSPRAMPNPQTLRGKSIRRIGPGMLVILATFRLYQPLSPHVLSPHVLSPHVLCPRVRNCPDDIGNTTADKHLHSLRGRN
jgi:hypothetical protein